MSWTRRRFLTAASGAAIAGRVSLGELRAASNEAAWRGGVAQAHRLLQTAADKGEVTAAALLVRRGEFELARGYGRAGVDTPFLIASPTKPMTVSAALLLRDRGQLAFADPVQKYLPQFSGGERAAVTVRQLLNHTSGLPDMLPENTELRKKHAPLSAFVEAACRTPLLLPPGEKVSYQSMGILLAAAIVEKISGLPMPAFLGRHIFAPLEMRATSLGLGGRAIAETAQCQVPMADRNDWDWNSAYWRNLAAPWGGAHSTVHDLARFLEAFVDTGPAPWPVATRREAREIQTGTLRPSYGHGWVREPGAFGKTCSPETFGHFGSTGTVFWHDPKTSTTCVVLTSRPAVDSKATVLVPVSELVGS